MRQIRRGIYLESGLVTRLNQIGFLFLDFLLRLKGSHQSQDQLFASEKRFLFVVYDKYVLLQILSSLEDRFPYYKQNVYSLFPRSVCFTFKWLCFLFKEHNFLLKIYTSLKMIDCKLCLLFWHSIPRYLQYFPVKYVVMSSNISKYEQNILSKSLA